jgi:oligoendopeptidase F
MLRGMKKAIEIFREENIPLFTELQNLETNYGALTGALMVSIKGEEKTLQQAGALLESTDRAEREEVYQTMVQKRLTIKNELNDLYSSLIEKRHQVALNAGFENYRDYAFASLGRFDYGPAECFEFHEAVAETVVPLLNEAAAKRKEEMGLDALKPFDKAVDPLGRGPLKPFETGEELLTKTIGVFDEMDPFLGNCLKEMVTLDRFDLDSRKGKNPGGYNYPLEETGYPFIFMNAAGTVRDVVTLLHEGGHAVHSILTKDLALNSFRNFPSEVAELASMSMELMTMDLWGHYFSNPEEAKRAKIKHLEDILETLPWVATIDAFPQASAVVTMLGSAATQYAQNLVYHKDAITFATADLLMPQGVDMASRQVHNGVSMRIVRQYDINNDRMPCRIDVLYGYSTIRPQMGVRLWG